MLLPLLLRPQASGVQVQMAHACGTTFATTSTSATAHSHPTTTHGGMATLIESVRSTGATNVILIGGMAWSNDLSQWNRWAPLEADQLQQTGAVWHAYDFNACHTQDCWERTISPVAARVPVVVTESGFDISWASGLWNWIEMQHSTVSYLAWTWNTWGGKEGLVSDYAKGTPTDPWGHAFKAQIAKAN